MSAANESGRSRPKSRIGDRRCPLIPADPSSDRKPQMAAASPKLPVGRDEVNGRKEPKANNQITFLVCLAEQTKA